MTKTVTFFVGFIVLLVFILLGLISQNNYEACFYSNEYGHTTNYCELFIFSFLPLLLFMPFSVILYFFRDEVFDAWWHFARWFVPVIIVVTFLLEGGGGGGLGIGGAISGAFNVLVISIFYIIFIVTSLIKIYRAYLKTKEHPSL